jgi:hypothetical protein
VRAALAAGVPAAQVYPHSVRASDAHPHEVRIAFDGDAVLFSDEAERVYQSEGLSAFQQHEASKATLPWRRDRSSPCWKPCTGCRPKAPAACACAPRW